MATGTLPQELTPRREVAVKLPEAKPPEGTAKIEVKAQFRQTSETQEVKPTAEAARFHVLAGEGFAVKVVYRDKGGKVLRVKHRRYTQDGAQIGAKNPEAPGECLLGRVIQPEPQHEAEDDAKASE